MKGPTSTGQRPGLWKTMLSLEETRELCHVTQKNTIWGRKTTKMGELGFRDVEHTDGGKVTQTKTINDQLPSLFCIWLEEALRTCATLG